MPTEVYEAVANLASTQDRSIHMQLVRCVKIGLEEEMRSVVDVAMRPRRSRKPKPELEGPDG